MGDVRGREAFEKVKKELKEVAGMKAGVGTAEDTEKVRIGEIAVDWLV